MLLFQPLSRRWGKMKVNFKNVGYSNASWSAECKELTEDWIYKQVKKYCMSKNLFVLYDEEKNEGVIFGGLRVIGEFSVEDTD